MERSDKTRREFAVSTMTRAQDPSATPVGIAPSVGVVVATHQRPQLLRRALASILDQEYDGPVEVVVVFDRSQPDHALEVDTDRPGRTVRVMANERTPGLAGARNTGVLALSTELVAFCDDDDVWLPGKLEAQVVRLSSQPEAGFVTTAMRVDVDGRHAVRLAERSTVTISDLARSRMAMLHSSSFLFRRSSMLDGFGLVDEAIPQSMGEDWDLLLRAAREHPIQHIDRPLVGVLWGRTSFFNEAWHDKNAAHQWLLERHPELSRDPVGLAMMQGKLAFGLAVTGQRRESLSCARQAVRTRWREPRPWLALLVLAGLPATTIQRLLNRRGYGI
jgi:glycosyltransferase involved in cell wall biosynthesis